jgi:hypothetical protein
MLSTFRALALVSIGLAAAAPGGFAQDGKPGEPQPAAPEKGDAAELLALMERLHPKALQRPKSTGQTLDPERAKAEDVWKASVRLLAKTGDDYFAALGGAAPEARALYYRGVGKALAAEIAGVSEKKEVLAAACDSLQRYLDGTDEKAAFRADAEMHLGRSLVHSGKVDESIVHLRRAVELLQKEGRHDDAGVCAFTALASLKALDRTKEMREFAEAVHAADGDFGGSTATVRKLLAASRLVVGSPLPEISAVSDVDDKPISFAAGGAPLLIHFFFTAMPGVGEARKAEEIDKAVRPLWDSYQAKGLRVVGVCMDLAMTPAQVEETKKKWEEWGKKAEFRDGSPASCREWMKKRGVEWQVRCSGQWTNDSVSTSLGGVGGSDPYAILVDKDGVVRWMGHPTTSPGLADEAAKLFK